MSFKASKFLGGAFLKVDDVKAAPLRADIIGYEVSEFNQNGRKDQKLTLKVAVNGEEKKLTLNSTNLRALVEAYGDDADLWTGRQIALYYDPNVMYAGKNVGGVRVHTGQRKAAQTQVDAAAALLGPTPAPVAAPVAAAVHPLLQPLPTPAAVQAAPVSEADEDPIPF